MRTMKTVGLIHPVHYLGRTMIPSNGL